MPPYVSALLEALSHHGTSGPAMGVLAILLVIRLCNSRWGLLITALLFRKPSSDEALAKLMEATRRRALADQAPSSADDTGASP